MELFTKHRDALGNAGFEQSFEVDVASIVAVKDLISDQDLLGLNIVSVQVVWSDLDGTKNGHVEVMESNDGINFYTTTLKTTLTSTSGNDMLSDDVFGGRFIGLKFSKHGLTGGKVKLTIVAKSA